MLEVDTFVCATRVLTLYCRLAITIVKFDVLLAGVFSHIRTECARDYFYVRFLLEGRSDLENI